jgi:hypothetical protein
MATKLVRMTAAEYTTFLGLGTHFDPTTPPQTVSSVAVGAHRVLAYDASPEGTVTEAKTVPQYIGGTFGVAATSGSYTISPMPSHQANDILFWLWMCRGKTTVEDLTGQGWALIENGGSGSSSNNKIVAYAKRAASGSETTPTMASISGGRAGAMMVVRGCPTSGAMTDIITFIGRAGSGSGTTTPQFPGTYSVPEAKSLIISALTTYQTAGLGSILSSGLSNSDLTSITTRNEYGATSTTLGRYIFTGERADAGVMATGSCVLSTSSPHATGTFAFKPA